MQSLINLLGLNVQLLYSPMQNSRPDVHIIGILAVLYEGTAVATEQSRLHKSLSTFAPHLRLFIIALSLKTVFVTLAPAPHA